MVGNYISNKIFAKLKAKERNKISPQTSKIVLVPRKQTKKGGSLRGKQWVHAEYDLA